jgi:iron complex transport system substrate-binding protein
MTTKARAKLLLLLSLGLLGGAHADIAVRDDTGQLLRLKQIPQRIVSLAPNATELLFAAGAGARIVGASEYSDYPEAARSIPRVGGALLDLETIAALRPDVIVAWADGNAPAQLQRLKQLDIPVYLSLQKRLDDIPATLERLGQLAGSSDVAQVAAAQFRANLTRLRNTYSARKKLRVFYQVWDEPLLTVNATHIISDALTTCGAENIFAKLPALTPTVSIENVLQADPDAIVTSSQDAQPPARLDAWRRWPRLSAVRNHHLYFVHADWIDRATPRILLGVAELCGLLDQVRATKR